MRVLHILQTLTGGGAEAMVRMLCRRMAKRGVESGAVTIYRANLSNRDIVELGVKLYEVDKKSRTDILAFARLMTAVRNFGPDLIHAHTYAGKYWGRAAAILNDIPVVFTEHGAAFAVGPIEKRISMVLDSRTDALVAFSDATASAVLKGAGRKTVRVIPNGVPLDLTYNRKKARELLECANDELSILTIGRLSKEKSPETAICAIRLLPEPILKRSRLHWIGTGPLRVAMERLVVQFGLENAVRFHGFRHDASTLLAAADVALSSSSIEAAPVWLLEALAAGVPIVGTPTLGVRDIVEADLTGIISKSCEPSSLSLALARALGDPKWRELAGIAARERARRYDIETVADSYTLLYREVIRARGRATEACSILA